MSGLVIVESMGMIDLKTNDATIVFYYLDCWALACCGTCHYHKLRDGDEKL